MVDEMEGACRRQERPENRMELLFEKKMGKEIS
jgi:hypothetical protein